MRRLLLGQLEDILFMSMIFETHAHYNDEAFQEDREAVRLALKELTKQGQYPDGLYQ